MEGLHDYVEIPEDREWFFAVSPQGFGALL